MLCNVVTSLQSLDSSRSTVDEVHSLLLRASSLMSSASASEQTQLLAVLLDSVWLHWSARLPDASLLLAFFDAHAVAPVAALTALLAAPPQPAAHWLARYADESLFRRAFDALRADHRALSQEACVSLARALLGAPTRLANALQGNVPPALRERPFAYRVLLDAFASAPAALSVALLAHAVAIGLSEVAGSALHRFATKSSQAELRVLFVAVPDHVQARLLAALLQQCSPSEMRAVLGSGAESLLALSLPAVENFLSSAALHGNRPLPTLEHLDVLVEHLVALAAPIESTLHVARLCDDVATVWSDETFISGATPDAEQYLTRALLRLLPHVGSEHVNSGGALLTRLIDGVRHRLSSPLKPVRLNGMRVGQVFSRVLDPTNPLDFEELRDEAIVAKVAPTAAAHERAHATPVAATVEMAKKTRKRTNLDPDAVIFDDDDDDDVDDESEVAGDAVVDSEDEFLALELNESDDEQNSDALVVAGALSSKSLSHIGELISALNEQENAARFEVALAKLPAALRGKPDDIDFETTVLALASQLLHLHNRFGLESFVENRLSSLCEACCAAPAAVAQYLTKAFYETQHDMQQRVVILEVLSRSAQRLAGVDLDGSTTRRAEPAPRIEVVASAVAVVSERVQANTRRWGDVERRRAPPSEASAFRAVADVFFFGLVGRVDEEHVQMKLMNGKDDGLLLGRLLQCAAIVVECAGSHHPTLERMVRLLLDLTLAVRFHRDPFVRRACAFAVVAAVSTVPAHLRSSALLTPLLIECRAWLTECAMDADPEVRAMASVKC
jgi:hypothetical protein